MSVKLEELSKEITQLSKDEESHFRGGFSEIVGLGAYAADSASLTKNGTCNTNCPQAQSGNNSNCSGGCFDCKATTVGGGLIPTP